MQNVEQLMGVLLWLEYAHACKNLTFRVKKIVLMLAQWKIICTFAPLNILILD